MANYHLEVKVISRGKGQSVTSLVSYIRGEKLRDSYADKFCYNQRQDVIWRQILLPSQAPAIFRDPQFLCNEIDRVERRSDARTAREFIGSLPNELPTHELIRIVNEFIYANFVSHDLCAIAAIHEGRSKKDPSKNNPHVHIIVPTRTVGSDGFCRTKDREYDQREYVNIWREQWALVQNQAYERNRLDIRVSHESLEVQGVRDREPTIHLSPADWQREKRGERTRSGNLKRKVDARNKERALQRQLVRGHSIERSR